MSFFRANIIKIDFLDEFIDVKNPPSGGDSFQFEQCSNEFFCNVV